ncbi:hypothetical protein [Paracoccus mutanolyticus]|uniref:hypothetical protein n=1 Tax=Paracoccus mutanolyticus TaxID=1499308 RepID=UPI001672E471|nr:hypothetical protein [Paracoccus mutanolyticus]
MRLARAGRGPVATTYYGRHEDELKVLPGLLAIVAPTEAEARDKYEELQQLIHPLVGLAHVYGPMGDLSAHPIDGPVPPKRTAPDRTRGAPDTAASNSAPAEPWLISPVTWPPPSTLAPSVVRWMPIWPSPRP